MGTAPEGEVMSEQTTIEVTCARCTGTRWIPVPYIPLNARGQVTGAPRDLREPDGYPCTRCRHVLAGRNDVKDPLASPETKARLQGITRRRLTGTTSESTVPGATIEPDP